MALGIKIPKNAFVAGKKEYKSGFNNVELEPGRHVCIVKKLRGVETSSGPSAVLDLKVAGESEQAGGTISIFFSTDPDRIKYLFMALDRLGYDVDELDDDKLDEIAEDIEANTPVVRITAKQKGEYVNYYIDKILDDVSAADVETKADADEGEEEEEEEEKSAKKKAKPEPEEEEEEKEEEKETEDEDEDEEEEDEEKSVKKTKKPAKNDEEDEDEEEAPEAGDDDEIEIEVGMKVLSTKKAWKGSAKIIAIDEKAGTVKVKTADGKIIKADADTIELP